MFKKKLPDTSHFLELYYSIHDFALHFVVRTIMYTNKKSSYSYFSFDCYLCYLIQTHYLKAQMSLLITPWSKEFSNAKKKDLPDK